jgi:hypothetical protein
MPSWTSSAWTRIYLNAYVPIPQSCGQVVAFMTQHLGRPIPSPALMEHIGTRFRKAVESYASSNGIPWVRFGRRLDGRTMRVPGADAGHLRRDGTARRRARPGPVSRAKNREVLDAGRTAIMLARQAGSGSGSGPT